MSQQSAPGAASTDRTEMAGLAREAREASRVVASLDGLTRDAVLRALAAAIDAQRDAVLAANAEDLASAEASGLSGPKLARLRLSGPSIDQMLDGLRQIASMADPLGDDPLGAGGEVRELASGLRVRRVRAPLGVVCMIYESRPGVTVDAFALCFKAGNACVLKGGREANSSNRCLAGIVRTVLVDHGVPGSAIVQVTTSDREQLRELLRQRESIDLVIPRGGESLIRFVAEHSSIPTVQHFKGVCHVYVDAAADVEMAVSVALSSKTSSPATCNTAECLLVHESIAPAFLGRFGPAAAGAGVELRADGRARGLLSGTGARVVSASEEDWGREYLDLVLAVRVVGSLDEAIGHIHRYASDHTEAIVTGDASAASAFCRRVQSSCVLVNASTRFNDGYQLGLGAEIGISTSRIHAYGPMGVEELTCRRFLVEGSGQVR